MAIILSNNCVCIPAPILIIDFQFFASILQYSIMPTHLWTHFLDSKLIFFFWCYAVLSSDLTHNLPTEGVCMNDKDTEIPRFRNAIFLKFFWCHHNKLIIGCAHWEHVTVIRHDPGRCRSHDFFVFCYSRIHEQSPLSYRVILCNFINSLEFKF